MLNARIISIYIVLVLGGAMVKNTPVNAGDVGSIPGWGRSPGEGNGSPLQYSGLKNPWTEVPGGLQPMGSRKSRTWLSIHGLGLRLGFGQIQTQAVWIQSLSWRPREPSERVKVVHFIYLSIFFPVFLKNLNWRIIASRCCVGFCYTTTWISCKCTYVSSLLNLPPTPCHIPPPLGYHRAPVWVPCVIQGCAF